MDTVARPTSDTETLARAKRAINNAVITLQRREAYSFAEQRETITATANTATFESSSTLTYAFRQLLAVDSVSTSSSVYGLALQTTSLGSLNRMRKIYQLNRSSYSDVDEWRYVTEQLGFNEFVQSVHQHLCFISGQSFGLFPTQTSDRYLSVHYIAWYPVMVDNDDTNPFLTYAYDVVFNLALRDLAVYLGKLADFEYVTSAIAEGVKSLDVFASGIKSYDT